MEDFEDFEDFFWRILRISRTSCAERRCILRIVRIFLLQKSPKLSKILQNSPKTMKKINMSSLTTEPSLLPCVCNPLARSAGVFFMTFYDGLWYFMVIYGGLWCLGLHLMEPETEFRTSACTRAF